jgi:hypothetical protein
MVRENAPPLATPRPAPVSENQVVDAEVSETVSDAPFNCAPEAAVKFRDALKRSRVVELPSRNTENPVEVMLMIFTDPGTITGAERPKVRVAMTGFAGRTDVPLAVKLASRTVMVPATVPT